MKTKTVVESKVTRKVMITDDDPKFGIIMSVKEFFDLVNGDVLVPKDGIGKFMIGDEVTNIDVWSVDFDSEFVNQFDRVVWFNK